MRQNFEYNDETSLNHGLILTNSYITRPVGEQKYTVYDVPGRDGGLYEKEESYESIEVVFSVMFRDQKIHANEHFRVLTKWLRGTGELKLEDIPGWHYNVLHVSVGEKSPIFMHRDEMAEFTVTFICDPYLYRNDGEREYGIEDVLWNPYNRCHPTFIISGYDDFVLTVNGNVLSGKARGNFTIDTDLLVAYDEGWKVLTDSDGVYMADADGALILVSDYVTEVSEYLEGNYEDLWLEEGGNTITISGDVEMSIIPNWRAL